MVEDSVDASIPLEGAAAKVAAGGDGRYLVISIPTVRQVVVFDLQTGSICKKLTLSSTQLFAVGGATSFVVVDAGKRGKVYRWKYDGGDLPEAVHALPSGLVRIIDAAMGLVLMDRFRCWPRNSPPVSTRCDFSISGRWARFH